MLEHRITDNSPKPDQIAQLNQGLNQKNNEIQPYSGLIELSPHLQLYLNLSHTDLRKTTGPFPI